MIRRLTDIPGPRSRALLERRERAVPRGPFNVAPVFVRSARGSVVEDVDGNTYLDFAGGLGCLNVGSCAAEVVEAVREQAGPFAPEVYRLPYAYCYRCPFGAEYPDCEMRCAGTTLEDFFKRYVAAESVAALIVEPILGEGGFVVPPREFLTELQKVCREHGILLIADEVQTGLGRTGSLFACVQFGLEPDLLVAAKSLGGGLPISSITGRAEVMDHPMVGGLGGTFGGNPLACRAALAVLDLIERENLCQRAVETGRKVLERFRLFQQKYQIVGDVRGLGAMCALELVRDRRTKEPAKEATERFTQLALRRGLITITAGTFGNVIRTLMPLVIGDEELEFGLDVIEQTLEEVRC